MDNNLVKRIGFAVVAIPLALGVVWYGGWPLTCLVILIAALGCHEAYALAEKQGVQPLRRTGLLGAMLLPLAFDAIKDPNVVLAGNPLLGFLSTVVLLLIVMLTIALFRRGVDQKPLSAVAITVFAIAYTSLLPSFLLIIRGPYPQRDWQGAGMVFFPLVVTWICDTAAMFGGRAFGKHKLAPTISPGKTREGAIAGVLGAAAVAVVFALWIFPPLGIMLDWPQAVIIAVILSIVGQMGDLLESLFKREAGVKDSSNLIPGHGGVLDRFDSLYFVIPIAALLYNRFGLI